ncbi:MAG TPA: polysaccharide biosynthesis/export family protein, partial [bacterium]|nr:polysaccharide biosynthesis/export family protein [bacterium]
FTGMAANAAKPLQAEVLHSGLNIKSGAPVLLINQGSEKGIRKGEEYEVSIAGRRIGILHISNTLPESAVGEFDSIFNEPAPRIGAKINISLLGGQDSSDTRSGGGPENNEIPEALKKGYKLGASDVLAITTIPENKLPHSVTVRPDGMISLPYVGLIAAAGRTQFEISEEIRLKLKKDFKDPWVEATVTEYHSKTVRVLGEVNKPTLQGGGEGEYSLKENVRLIDFVAKIGGLGEKADVKRLRLIRRNSDSVNLDLTKAIEEPNSEMNVMLEDGDVIYVPTISESERVRVMMLGQIGKQGMIELDPAKTTIMDAISTAEGLSTNAALDQIFVVRMEGKQQTVTQLRLDKIKRGLADIGFQVQNGDIIYFASVKTKKPLDRLNDLLKDIIPSLNFILLIDRL